MIFWSRFGYLLLLGVNSSWVVNGFSLGTSRLDEARQRISDIIGSNGGIIKLDDGILGASIDDLLAEATDKNKIFNPENVAGTWRVVHAPHLAFLSNIVLAKFNPIEYHLSTDGKMASSVRYNSFIAGYGWFCTSGSYHIDPTNGNVRITWDKCWWNTEYLARPTPAEEGTWPSLIQSIGMVGFIQRLSFFPIAYVDNDLVTFYFFGFSITACRADDPQPGIFVSRRDSA